MRPSDLELVRLSRTERRIRLGIAAVALLLLVAVVKPWPGQNGSLPGSATPAERVAAASAGSSTSAEPSASGEAGPALCVSPDGWRIVADDTELGRTVRTWLVADVELSAALPERSTVPVTTLVSSEVEHLGFCRPAGSADAGTGIWRGTLWRESPDLAAPVRWQLAARLSPAPGSIGALASPQSGATNVWQPGLYFLEAEFAGSNTETWLGLLIERGPG